MKSRRINLIAALSAPVLVGGCVAVPRDAGFSSVQKTVAERTGAKVQWNQGTDADKQVADAVREILSRELSADDAVQIALLNNQNLQATYEDLGIAQAELVEAGLLKNPTLAAEVRIPKHAALPFEINIAQSFVDLLTLPLRKRAAGAAFDAAKWRVTNEVLNAAAETRASFYRAQGAAQLVEMRRSIVLATEASWDAAKRMREAGNVTELVLANERALHEQAKIDLAKAERDALDAREELSGQMGVWGPSVGWTIAARLPDLPAGEIESAKVESLAVSRRADLAAAAREVEVVGQTLGLTRSTALFADLTVGGHFEKDPDGTTTVGPTIEVPLPIFNQGQPAIAAGAARFRQSRMRYAAMAVLVRTQVRRARNRLVAARDLAQYYNRVVIPLRHEIVQQSQLQFNAMQTGLFELLRAKQAEIDAGREYVETLKDYWVATAELERASGGRVEFSARVTTQPANTSVDATTRPAADEDGHAQHHHHGE